jgi:hypothetical protein
MRRRTCWIVDGLDIDHSDGSAAEQLEKAASIREGLGSNAG